MLNDLVTWMAATRPRRAPVGLQPWMIAEIRRREEAEARQRAEAELLRQPQAEILPDPDLYR